MYWKQWLGTGLALWLGGTAAAQAPNAPSWTTRPGQSIPGIQPTYTEVQQAPTQPVAPPAPPGEPASRPAERAAEEGKPPAEPKWGPTAPEDVKLLMDHTFLGDWLKESGCGTRIYGWADMGYTYASTGPGLLSVETRENRFGNEFLVNQLAVVVDKPLKADELSFGYNATFYAGADAALLRPRGGFTTTDPRFGLDFRQLYASAHLPILSDGGVDVKAGRMGTIIGYESALAPYRPFYSNDYQWFYAEDGAWTGLLTNWHVNKQLDILNGITLGANTFFTLRGTGPTYIGQVNYWVQEQKKTLLTAGIQVGNQAIFSAPGFVGDVQTVLELRVQHEWNKYLTQIVQSHLGWETETPDVGTTQFYGLYTILIYHMDKELDVNFRAEWFDDQDGSRTGIRTAYEEVTLGFDYHPATWISLRPEIRGDFADERAFGGGGNPRNHSQLTLAIDALLKF